MPRPDPFTPTRRLMLQVIMWTVFAATIVMAGLIVHTQKRSRNIDLAKQPIISPGLSLSLPNKWRRRPNASPNIIVEAAETARTPRILTVYRDALDLPLSPEEYLGKKFAVDLRDDEQSGTDELYTTQQTRFGVYPGIIKGGMRIIAAHMDEAFEKVVYAAAVLPSGDAIAIKLEGPGELTHNDLAIVDQVARSIQLTDQPTIALESQPVTFENGTRFTAPSVFRLIENRDPNITHRRFWYAATTDASRDGLQWASIEAIPCALAIPSDSKKQPKVESQLLTMLLARDTSWRGAAIQRRDPNEFFADLPHPAAGIIFPTRACFRTDNAGHAFLAIIRAPGEGIDNHWSEIRASIAFPKTSDVDDLTRAGIAEVARLHELPLDELLKNRDEQWHLWVNQSAAPHVGWSRLKWKPNLLVADVEHHLRLPDEGRINIIDTWSASPDWNRFHSDLTSNQTTPDAAPFAIQRQFDVHGDTLSLSANATNKPLALWSQSAPANYIPGPLLPQLIAKLSPTNMILTTDSFLTREAIAAPALLTLLIRESATDATTRPGRTVTVEILGTGERSTWTFDAEGSLRSIDFPAGLQRLPSNEPNIKLIFPAESTP
jgi:hypothetical protein